MSRSDYTQPAHELLQPPAAQRMTRAQYAARARKLCNLVNARRIQDGKEPLRKLHIMRVVRLALGPAPALAYPNKRSPVRHDRPIPYAMTEKALSQQEGKDDG